MQNTSLRRKFWIGCSLALMLLFHFLPPFSGMSESAMTVLGLFIGVLLLWLFVAIDWPSLVLLAGLMTVPEWKTADVFAASFGSPTVLFLLFTFVLTHALAETGILRRIAVAFITCRPARRGPWHFVALYFAGILFLGSFISPTVLFFLYLPMLEEMYAVLGLKKGDPAAALLMMGTVIMTGISSGMTPIAHVFPLIAMNAYEVYAGVPVSVGRYLLLAVPVGLVTAAGMLLLFRLLLHPDPNAFHPDRAERLKERLFQEKNAEEVSTVAPLNERALTAQYTDGQMHRARKVVGIFLFVLFLWIAPDLLVRLIPLQGVQQLFSTLHHLGPAFPPLIGCVMLALFSDDGKPLLSLDKAFREGIAWPAILMCAGTGALGWALTQPTIGWSEWLAAHLSSLASSFSPALLFFFFALWASLQTNLSSNMVTATVVSAAAIGALPQLLGISGELLLSMIGMLSAYAFATPPAMPCVAIAGSSGWTTTRQMMRYGFLAMLIGVVVASAWACCLNALFLG